MRYTKPPSVWELLDVYVYQISSDGNLVGRFDVTAVFSNCFLLVLCILFAALALIDPFCGLWMRIWWRRLPSDGVPAYAGVLKSGARWAYHVVRVRRDGPKVCRYPPTGQPGPCVLSSVANVSSVASVIDKYVCGRLLSCTSLCLVVCVIVTFARAVYARAFFYFVLCCGTRGMTSMTVEMRSQVRTFVS